VLIVVNDLDSEQLTSLPAKAGQLVTVMVLMTVVTGRTVIICEIAGVVIVMKPLRRVNRVEESRALGIGLRIGAITGVVVETEIGPRLTASDGIETDAVPAGIVTGSNVTGLEICRLVGRDEIGTSGRLVMVDGIVTADMLVNAAKVEREGSTGVASPPGIDVVVTKLPSTVVKATLVVETAVVNSATCVGVLVLPTVEVDVSPSTTGTLLPTITIVSPVAEPTAETPKSPMNIHCPLSKDVTATHPANCVQRVLQDTAGATSPEARLTGALRIVACGNVTLQRI
jgi:hypothetical protein